MQRCKRSALSEGRSEAPSLHRAAATIAVGAVLAWTAVLGPVRLRVVRGSSMAPALRPGDVCVVRTGPEPIAGDVVLFEKEGWPGGVLHRVTARHPDGSVTTRGDANPIPDRERVVKDGIVGVCVAVLPTGRAAAFLASLRGGTLRGQSNSAGR